MKLKNEDDILNPDIRIALIKEMEADENRNRKRASYKRYEIFKDRIKKYILESLTRELDPQTVEDMQSRIASINLYKKVVSKKARVFKTAPRREAQEGTDQDQLDGLISLINLNVRMKKTNKYLEAFLNTDVFVRPLYDSQKDKWFYRVDPLAPHQYDVIEDSNDPERAMGYLLSPFVDQIQVAENPADRHKTGYATGFRDGNQKDEMIADSPADKEKEYIWWGNKYHFTFNTDGKIISDKSPEDGLNPIQKLPIVSFARDRDGSFWAVGGEDLIDGSILINTILSDIYYIAKLHGTGLFYFFGKGVPKTFKVGPNNGITHEVQGDDPIPTIGFANANPQLKDHMDLVEQYVAMLLTTNDLEPGAVQGKLSAGSGTSGVQEMIIKSEPINAVEDDQEIFRDLEPEVLNVAAKWHNLYLSKGQLREDFAELKQLPEQIDYTIKFSATQQFASEKEKLEVLEKRINIGLDDIIGAIMIDNPDMEEKEAIEKAKEMQKRNMERMKTQLEGAINANNEEENPLPPKPVEGAGPPKDGETENGSKE